VEDLGSRNGTFVNNERVNGRAILYEGDQILVCDQLLAFRLSEAPPSLGGASPLHESSLSDPISVDDDGSDNELASVMATLDLAPGTGSWRLSAKPEVKLGAMIEISNNLGKTFSVEEILPKLLDSLFKIFVQADRGFVVMRPKPDGPLVSVCDKLRRPDSEEKMRISRTIIEEAMRSRRAILSADAASDERFSMAQSIADLRIRSMICAPMIDGEGNALGAIQIETMNQRSRFTDEDLEVLAGVAGQAAVAIDNAKMHEQMIAQRALQQELEVAQQMQRGLLPAAPPEVPGYSFFDYYQSARQVLHEPAERRDRQGGRGYIRREALRRCRDGRQAHTIDGNAAADGERRHLHRPKLDDEPRVRTVARACRDSADAFHQSREHALSLRLGTRVRRPSPYSRAP
jgi:hypothetical protein